LIAAREEISRLQLALAQNPIIESMHAKASVSLTHPPTASVSEVISSPDNSNDEKDFPHKEPEINEGRSIPTYTESTPDITIIHNVDGSTPDEDQPSLLAPSDDQTEKNESQNNDSLKSTTSPSPPPPMSLFPPSHHENLPPVPPSPHFALSPAKRRSTSSPLIPLTPSPSSTQYLSTPARSSNVVILEGNEMSVTPQYTNQQVKELTFELNKAKEEVWFLYFPIISFSAVRNLSAIC
jgi:hypothetical protein